MGIHLKILHDKLPSLRVVVTGSLSFDLATKLGEPMTGRKRVYTLFPLSQEELGLMYNSFELKDLLSDSYFWRLYTGAEIDYVEENQGVLTGYEIKWGQGKLRIPKSWTETYKADVQLLNRENYLDLFKI